ncbi:MAG: EF-P lysine aminoacylase EpmA [Polyangiaceae bacterium]
MPSTPRSVEPTISPADAHGLAGGARVRVGGRVLVATSRELVLHDDRATITATLANASDVFATGDLVVLEGLRAGVAHLHDALVISRTQTAARSEGAPSDVARFFDGGVGARLRLRAVLVREVRAHFDEAGFLEVDTPVLAPCPGLDLHLDAFEVVRGERYLLTSPEYQMKRLLVGGVPRCFQLAKSFRRGERGSRHNPEFTMLEWYRAFADLDEVIADTEALIVRAAAVGRTLAPSTSTLARLELARPFERISVAAAFERYAHVGEARMLELAHGDEDTFFRVLVDEVEPALASARGPVVLERYPAPMASLARLCPDDPRYAERFELYADGVELCNGFGELTDPLEQRARFERDLAERARRGLPLYPIDERFIGALAEGMPPAAGNALGLDRLVMLAAGATSLEDVLAFPDGEL